MPPGGKVSEYIPFYFGPSSPMLFRIATGFDGVKKCHQGEVVYIISSLDKIREHNLPYFFTDGHLKSLTSTAYNDDRYLDRLDWDVVFARFWKSDDTDLRRQEKKQAELLVKGHVPVNAFELFGVYNEKARQTIAALLSEAQLDFVVKVSPEKLYYDHLQNR